MMPPKRWIGPIFIIVVMLLSGCTGRTTEDNANRSNNPSIVRGTPKTFVYECSNDFSFVARVEDDIVWVFLPYKTLKLTREPSASGEKFSDSQTLFWAKKNTALLEYNRTKYRNCINNRARAIWEHAKLNGVDFRAVGNEPGWYLEIRAADTILFVGDYGNARYEFHAPHPLTEQPARKTIYQTKAGDKSLTVIIEGRSCNDSMSGEAFEATVQVQLNQIGHQGCGRALH